MGTEQIKKKYSGMKGPYDNLQSSDLIKNNNNKNV